jgi:hypothetical protein
MFYKSHDYAKKFNVCYRTATDRIYGLRKGRDKGKQLKNIIEDVSN